MHNDDIKISGKDKIGKKSLQLNKNNDYFYMQVHRCLIKEVVDVMVLS